jgi:NADPH-dependent 2,4-dienoyl-CoA reductase/sulfur reductase-like enzyme
MRLADQIYAAGDIAAFPLPGGGPRVRVEHWRVAQQQARIAARNMLGGDAAYDGVPFFWTYHFGKRFEYLGHAEKWDEVVIEGDLDRQDFVALLVRGGMIGAIVACGRERETAILAERLRRPVSADTALRIIRAA